MPTGVPGVRLIPETVVIGVISGLIYLFENLLGIPVAHIPIGCDFVIGKLWKDTPFRHVAETLLI
jgi:hypothetical protein